MSPTISRTVWALTVAILSVSGGSGCRRCCLRLTPQPPPSSPFVVLQEFPAGGPTQTAWRVHWAEEPNRGLYITGAWFRRSPSDAFIRVLYDARLSQIFVPYHSGSPRYHDLTGFGFQLIDATPADAGCCGTRLGTPPKVVKELRDRGPAWKNDAMVYRGQELVLWGTLDAANYNYIMEYGFRDDGTVSFRLGATAMNLPGREYEAHMHNGLWRLDVDLGGASPNSALLMKHVEPPGSLSATDSMLPFNGGTEGAAVWEPTEFTEVSVSNPSLRNARGHSVMYDLMPIRGGTARHVEAFTRSDFWVTRYKASEIQYESLPSYVSNGESISSADVVLWYMAPMHHLPRDEDGEYLANGRWDGSALVMWSAFELRPRNLFAKTPLYP